MTIKQIESGQRRPSRQLAELFATSLEIPADEHETADGLVVGVHFVRTPEKLRALQPPTTGI